MHRHDAPNAPHTQAHEPHGGSCGQPSLRPLAIALGITSAFLIAEVVGGMLTNSLALLADASHMATDAIALALSLVAVWLARRPVTPERSFGYHRAEVLAALLNAAALIIVSLSIFWEAYERLTAPPSVDSLPMLAVAIAGLGANLASAWVLMRGDGHKHNLNTRSAFLHVIGDLLGSVGAIGAAIIMLTTGWYLADPLLSALIGLLVLRGAWRLLTETVGVLMESTPSHVDVAAVRTAVEEVEGVRGLHDLHIWTVTSGFVALSAHVEVDALRPWPALLADVTAILRDQFGIAHLTLQPETADSGHAVFHSCATTSAEQRTCTQPRTQLIISSHGHHH